MERRLDLLHKGRAFLKESGIVNAKGEAEIFLSHFLKCARVELYLDNTYVPEQNAQDYWQALKSRKTGFPLQYLLGSIDFMGLELRIKSGVFVPRPETELLVETLLTHARLQEIVKPQILDIGTGCGNIAIALADKLTHSNVFACDICHNALQLARENAKRHQVEVTFFHSDVFSNLNPKGTLSLIISNPPYIKSDDIASLPKEVHHEPKRALDGGADGLLFYKRIIARAFEYLRDDGYLAFEVGDTQEQEVTSLLTEHTGYTGLATFKDYNGISRIVWARKKKNG